MSAAELDEYPRGIFHTSDLDNTAQVIGVADEEVRVKWAQIRGGDGAQVITWQSSDGSVAYFKTEVSANENIRIEAFRIRPTVGSVEGGLSIISDQDGNNLRVSVFYHATLYSP